MYVHLNAPAFCQIQFVCNGQLIRIRFVVLTCNLFSYFKSIDKNKFVHRICHRVWEYG